MPSEQALKQKQQLVTELTEKIKGATAGVLVDYKGISVAEDTAMRKEMREAGIDYFVMKNTMLRFAFKECGYDALNDYLEGTTAIALSTDDVVAPAKLVSKYVKELAENTDFAVKAGFMEGKVIDAATVAELGNLPAREQLLGMLVSVLVAPMRGLAVAVNAIADQNGEEAPAAE